MTSGCLRPKTPSTCDYVSLFDGRKLNNHTISRLVIYRIGLIVGIAVFPRCILNQLRHVLIKLRHLKNIRFEFQ